MNEQKSPNPPLYKTVDTLFHSVMDRKLIPKYFKNHPDVSATSLGAGGTTAVLETTQHMTEKFLPYFYNHIFQSIEEVCVAGLTLTLGYLGSKGKLEKWANEHPVYTPGMIGVVSSAYIVALTDLLIR